MALSSRIARLAAGIGLLGAVAGAPGAGGLPLHTLRLPEGFHVQLYTGEVPGARSLTLGPDGVVFVGTRSAGRVYAAVDDDGDGRAERVHTVASGLFQPNGVAFRDGALYVAEVNRILRFDAVAGRLDDPPPPVVITEALPSETHHGWRFIAFGPDGRLYVPIGAPCNICLEPGFAEIRRIDPQTGELETFARGVRNTVGFDWHPVTGALWFTDNGRDWLGDDLPPDELNRAPRAGLHFGFPFCHGRAVSDPEFGEDRRCEELVAPAWEMGAHVAALGMRFYTGEMFPPRYRHQIFIAQHGSWNRSTKVGYRVIRVEVQDGRAVDAAPFVEGWLQGQHAWGRPVDVLVMPDGALLISDDKAGAIYRVTYDPTR